MKYEECKDVAETLWQMNKANVCQVGQETAAKLKGLPPIVLGLPEVPGFLAHLQKLSFMGGVLATLNSIEEIEAPTEEPEPRAGESNPNA